MNPIVQQLRDRRIALGLTQRDVTARTGGLSTSVLSTAERGLHQPGLEVLTRWAGALGLVLQLVEQPTDGAG